ncbi:MAG: RHS repeat protein [Spirochaetales bacterium]|nr:RHS repeat protein [Spirochaetales bacterium]
MSRKILSLLFVIVVLCTITQPVNAEEQTVFGPSDFEISRWRIHFSAHRFSVDNPGEGVITITKNTPDKNIRKGFIVVNRRIISLRAFLRGDEPVFEKKIRLRSRNFLLAFLRGAPGASLNIEVKTQSPIPPPEVTFSANPQTITIGESSTLTWNTTYANSVSIDQGIGSVDLSGSIEVSPTETTTYTLTATGPGGSVTDSATTTVIHPPTVNISASPNTILLGESATLSWSSNNADFCIIEPDIGSVDVNGSTLVSPVETTTYTITATGSSGSTIDTAEVIVLPEKGIAYGLDVDEQQGGGGLAGETVRILNGNIVEYRSDLGFSSPNRHGLSFAATYNSRSGISGVLGFGWTHTYSVVLNPAYEMSGQTYLKIIDQTGRTAYFTEEIPGIYKGEFSERSQVKTEAGGYVWYRLDGSRYGFSSTEQLLWLDDEKGNRLALGYDTQERLETATDTASGRVLTFNYNIDSLLESISGPVTAGVPSGIWVTYGYDANQNLISVTYADGSGFTYTYSDTEDVHNLTEKRDKTGHLLNTWTYDTQDRNVDNFSVQGKGVSIQYVGETQVEVTDAYGTVRIYTIGEVNGLKRVTAMQGPAGAPYSSSNVVRWSYDSQMNLIEVETAGNTIHQYLNYDDRGNPGILKLAFGTPEERAITCSYHPDMNAPLTRTEASVLGTGNKETIWDYDDDYDTSPNENPTSLVSRIVEQGFTRNGSGAIVVYEYVTTFTYNPKGQVLSVDGPLPGNGDTTSFTYDPTTGNLLSITRPLIGATSFSNYDAAGKVGLVTDVNSQSKGFTYDGRGRVTLITNNADGSTNSVIYNTAGLLDSRTDEDGVISSFEYDPVYGRLSRRTDHVGNYISYDYDPQGNMIEKSYYDPLDVHTNRKRYLYQDPAHNMPGKLYKEIHPDDTFTKYGYDLEGSISSVTDANNNTTSYEYDPLNRLITVIQPGTVVNLYTYDGHGNLQTVTDAESHTTTYEYDDMGRLLSTTSPDTGTVTYVYDEAGNPVNKTDAKGITVGYEYDLLNRLTDLNFPDSTQDITYTYDTEANGIGRRTGMTDPSGSTTFGYDARGRLVGKTSVINSLTYSVFRSYTMGGRISSLTYPTGRAIDYDRSACACSVDGVSTTYNGNTITLAENLSYRPFGIAKGMNTGAGGTVNNEFDLSGRLMVANPGTDKERTYTYDNNGNLTSVTAPNTPWYNRAFTYDALNRLDHAEGPYGIIDYTYDDVGNRLTKVESGVTENYAYFTGTNKLEQTSNGDTVTYSYDANSNITGIGNKALTYNQNNRLIRVEEDANILGEYTYNGLGQRIIKEVDGITTIFHYDFNGNIIAESDPDGNFSKECLYRGKGRSAMVDVSSGEIYYFGNDRLGTPQILTDSTNTVVWEGIYKPFGEAEVNPNSSVVNNFRLPGQYYDAEAGLHYNYHRYYDPRTGRYLNPDPVGVLGGINLFLYGDDNPINMIDPYGLFKFNAELKQGLAASAKINLFGGLKGEIEANLGTEHKTLFGDNYVSQGLYVKVVGGPAAVGLGVKREAKGDPIPPKFDIFGNPIPGTGRGIPHMLRYTEWEVVDIFKIHGIEAAKVSIGAQFLLGFEISIDFSEEVSWWFDFFRKLLEDECE